MDEEIREYRSYLVSVTQQAQSDFDKTILSLSGGALGISFAFIENFVDMQSIRLPILLLLAWSAWGFSVTCILISFYTSQTALRKAIGQVDENPNHLQSLGGAFDKITGALNIISGVLFLSGVLLMIAFVSQNIN